MSDRHDHPEPVTVLLVEDSPADIELTRSALADSKLLNTIEVVTDGAEALRYLRREGPYADKPRPHLVLLDLNLPKVDGREVLRQIREDPSLRALPVVVLTTSSQDEDILRSYELAANCYVTKPIGLDAFTTIVQQIGEFWLTVVRLPEHR